MNLSLTHVCTRTHNTIHVWPCGKIIEIRFDSCLLLLQWFLVGANGERNQMISAWKFLYKQRQSYKWGYVPYSRSTLFLYSTLFLALHLCVYEL